ncbi:hypothetical protein GYMLUDRAFT_243877 [Collybiopsis luxurians FD-317 M1]|uniref:Reverse transcriptase Ty1/copia-type domain-containing protein n=1 Tax=Collybiopsis luxurians FD-317 M1 TaxID=944289 RepID=A0A0D0BBY4_9AGAR|nr:hypothetical protein GYMLUDRAFT_243877 [Collybiopsis luxurians FD-317 M1]
MTGVALQSNGIVFDVNIEVEQLGWSEETNQQSQPTPNIDVPQPKDAPPVPPLSASALTMPNPAPATFSLEYQQDENCTWDKAADWATAVVMVSTIKGGGEVAIPKSYNKAMQNLSDWIPLMQKEIDSLQAHNCWTLVDWPSNVKILNGMWVFNLKLDGDGNVLK